MKETTGQPDVKIVKPSAVESRIGHLIGELNNLKQAIRRNGDVKTAAKQVNAQYRSLSTAMSDEGY